MAAEEDGRNQDRLDPQPGQRQGLGAAAHPAGRNEAGEDEDAGHALPALRPSRHGPAYWPPKSRRHEDLGPHDWLRSIIGRSRPGKPVKAARWQIAWIERTSS